MTESLMYSRANREDAAALWRIADGLRADANRREEEARDLRNEAKRLDRIAAAVADGRPIEDEL